ncbi:diaminopimelate decarboxylase [Haliovirga abyssi]|uniref:Diaminopimelate decarboxylase n=1 Tax=Haliovirga abyssi TaxID=2996794 RepID=A0AAU9DFL9_9FUSO|nr:diaminopimelate decarboxylase [Haliovirga abyssi]BDU50182.1 diaminopimelate decarboxylase [Haliovirga abyssi]
MAVLHGTMKVKDNGHLLIGGVDVVEVARESEFPVYVLDEELLRKNMREYRKTFEKYYPNSMVHYASKALMTLAMCKIVESEGLGIDVVSGGELYTAIKAGFPMDKVVMHGNNKSVNEIKMGIENGVKIVIDNFYEIELVDKITKELNKSVDVLLRIKPGIHADTHHYVSTGHEDSKFGFIIKEDTAKKAIKQVVEKELINFKGIHMHIGSQIFNVTGYEKSIEIMADFIKELKEENIIVKEFDLGGGLGVIYTQEDDPMSITDFVKLLIEYVKREFEKRELELPKLMVEPGRSIVGEAGTTVYQVGSITEVPGIRKYIAINGGMGDNIRPALYGSKYDAVIANRMNGKEEELVTVAGKCCETGDIILKDIKLNEPKSGDVLAVFTTGAYNYTMASNYNRLPIPGVMLVNNGQKEWIVKPQSYEDILRNDIIPERLK